MKTKKSLIGRKAKFVYPDYGTPNGHPDYTEHSGQIVTILSLLKKIDPEVGQMFGVQAEDGWIGKAYRDELIVKKNS